MAGGSAFETRVERGTRGAGQYSKAIAVPKSGVRADAFWLGRPWARAKAGHEAPELALGGPPGWPQGIDGGARALGSVVLAGFPKLIQPHHLFVAMAGLLKTSTSRFCRGRRRTRERASHLRVRPPPRIIAMTPQFHAPT